MPFASDYSRYLPNTPGNRRGAGWATMLGNFVTLVWMGILGTLLGSTTTASDSIGALKELMGPWAAVGLGVVALSSFTQNFLNVYGGAISIQTMGVPVKRHTAVVFICVASYFVALWGQTGFNERLHRLPQPDRLLHRPVRSCPRLRLPVRRQAHRTWPARAFRQRQEVRMGLRGLGRRRGTLLPVLDVLDLHWPHRRGLPADR